MAPTNSTWECTFLPVLKRTVCRIAFGCEALGGFAWGDVDVEEIQRAIRQAIEGVGPERSILFDTSDTYGPNLSEERLGEALASQGNNVVVATKFGVRLTDGRAWYDNSASYADQALDLSLGRLRRDSIDLYQLHWPDRKARLADTLSTLEKFREEGRIKAYGVCNVSVEELAPLVGNFPGLISFSQSYSLVERRDREAIRSISNSGLVFLAYGCLAQGLLSGKYTADSTFGKNDRRTTKKYVNFHGQRLSKILRNVDHLKQESNKTGVPTPSLALQFVLEDLPSSIALAGIKSANQWSQNMRALQSTLPIDSYNSILDHLDETIS